MSTAKATTSDQIPAARLIDERRKIERAKIIWDAKLWPRNSADQERVKEFVALYKDEPGVLPIIKVAEHPTKKGFYRGIDGWHRNAAQSALKWKETEAEVYASDTDVFAEATRLSSISSKPLTILEKRAAVRRLLDQHKDWSDRRIARIAGVSNTFVGNQRKGLTRLAGEIKDMAVKALQGDGSTSGATTREKPEPPGINQLLFNVLQDGRITNVSLETWRNIAARFPEYKPVMRHVGTVLVQAALDQPAPARPVNVDASGTSGQKPAPAPGSLSAAVAKYQQKPEEKR